MLTITIGGVDRTSKVRIKSLHIDNVLNQQRDTVNLTVGSADASFRPQTGQEIIITDETPARIFAGTIDTVRQRPWGAAGLLYELQCVDYTQLLDRHLVARVYTNQTAGAMIRDIIAQDCAGEGLTTVGVQDGPLVDKATFNYVPASQAIQEIVSLVGYAWYVDYGKDVHVFARDANLAPISLSDVSANYLNMRVEQTREQYRNRQYIRAGQDITSPRTEQFPGDGKTKTFVLGFPCAKMPTVTVNAVAKTVGIRGLETGKDFYWSKSEKEITQDDAAVALVSTDTLAVTYQGLFPIILSSQSDVEISGRAAAEGGSGIYEAIEDDASIDSQTLATQKADGLLRRFGRIPRIVEFETHATGLMAGQLINITNTRHGLTGQYLISRVSTRWAGKDATGDRYLRSVQALDGEALGGWVDFFRQLAQAGRKFVIRENEVLILLRRFSDAVVLADTLTATAAALGLAEVGSAVVSFSEHSAWQSDFYFASGNFPAALPR